MSKKVTFTPKLSLNPRATADEWVNGSPISAAEPTQIEAAQTEKTKRFTFDVPESLHRRVKARCAENGVDMADEMRRLLEQKFPKS